MAELEYFFIFFMIGAVIEAYCHPKIVKSSPALGKNEVGNVERETCWRTGGGGATTD